jgi:hypothetical protein
MVYQPLGGLERKIRMLVPLRCSPACTPACVYGDDIAMFCRRLRSSKVIDAYFFID